MPDLRLSGQVRDLKNIQKQTAPRNEQSDAYLAAEQYLVWSGQRPMTSTTTRWIAHQGDHEAKLTYEEVQEYLWAKQPLNTTP